MLWLCLPSGAAVKPLAELGLCHQTSQLYAVPYSQAGEAERAPGEQWARAVGPPGPALLAAAPEDEVLAEMLALQNELVQQAAANRARLVPALAGVLGELDARAAAAAQRAAEEAEVKAWIVVRGKGRVRRSGLLQGSCKGAEWTNPGWHLRGLQAKWPGAACTRVRPCPIRNPPESPAPARPRPAEAARDQAAAGAAAPRAGAPGGAGSQEAVYHGFAPPRWAALPGVGLSECPTYHTFPQVSPVWCAHAHLLGPPTRGPRPCRPCACSAGPAAGHLPAGSGRRGGGRAWPRRLPPARVCAATRRERLVCPLRPLSLQHCICRARCQPVSGQRPASFVRSPRERELISGRWQAGSRATRCWHFCTPR